MSKGISRWFLSDFTFDFLKEGYPSQNGKPMSMKSVGNGIIPSEHLSKQVSDACDRFFIKRQRMKDFEEYRKQMKANRHPISE
jgi:hypothetical protein